MITLFSNSWHLLCPNCRWFKPKSSGVATNKWEILGEIVSDWRLAYLVTVAFTVKPFPRILQRRLIKITAWASLCLDDGQPSLGQHLDAKRQHSLDVLPLSHVLHGRNHRKLRQILCSSIWPKCFRKTHQPKLYMISLSVAIITRRSCDNTFAISCHILPFSIQPWSSKAWQVEMQCLCKPPPTFAWARSRKPWLWVSNPLDPWCSFWKCMTACYSWSWGSQMLSDHPISQNHVCRWVSARQKPMRVKYLLRYLQGSLLARALAWGTMGNWWQLGAILRCIIRGSMTQWSEGQAFRLGESCWQGALGCYTLVANNRPKHRSNEISLATDCCLDGTSFPTILEQKQVKRNKSSEFNVI